MSDVDGFIILEGIIADCSKLISIKVSAQVLVGAVEPVLGIPVFRGAIGCFGWDWSVDFFFPLFVTCDFAVNRGECIVE